MNKDKNNFTKDEAEKYIGQYDSDMIEHFTKNGWDCSMKYKNTKFYLTNSVLDKTLIVFTELIKGDVDPIVIGVKVLDADTSKTRIVLRY